MDFLKSQFDRIQQQLAGLTASQKMLAACLVVIIVMTLGLSGRYAAAGGHGAGRGPGPVAGGAERVRRQLHGSGIPYKIVGCQGGRCPPTASSRPSPHLRSPGDSQRRRRSTFQSLVKDINPFDSVEHDRRPVSNKLKQPHARASHLASSPACSGRASSSTPPPSRASPATSVPTATISIHMKPGEQPTQRRGRRRRPTSSPARTAGLPGTGQGHRRRHAAPGPRRHRRATAAAAKAAERRTK